MKTTVPIVAIFLVSVLVGGLMAYSAWEHNPQGEFYEGESVHYLPLFTVFGTWWALAMGVLSPFVIFRMIQLSGRIRNKP